MNRYKSRVSSILQGTRRYEVEYDYLRIDTKAEFPQFCKELADMR